MPGVTVAPPLGKAVYHGLEVTESVTWRGWEPGKEYTKNIVLKNLKVKTQKLKYKVPKTRFFNTLYPTPIVLSAGTSYTLPVTFRALEKIVYKDEIQFVTDSGNFKIPISAILPENSMDVPPAVQFNMCAVQDLTQLQFDIRNTCELVTPFQVDCKEPFFLEPAEGILEPFSACTITATFRPKAAVVYEAHAVFRYGNDFSHAEITKLEGIGKYPHLLVSSSGVPSSNKQNKGEMEAVVNFGTVSIGKNTERFIELQNLSPVNSPFTIENAPGTNTIDTVFTCKQRKGVVPAMSTVRIPMVFTPNILNSQSIDYFHVKAIGNVSKTVVKCTGASKGPRVNLSTNTINFMKIDAGKAGTKTFDIVNDSDTEASFQFSIDCRESVFKFQVVSGVLPPKTKKTIIMKFEPYYPINYYRRVTCLVHNQDPLFLDLLGTCHTETSKPAVLLSKHITRYNVHQERGFSFIAPEQLNDMVNNAKLNVDEGGCLYDPSNEGQDLSTPVPPLEPMDEYFNDGYYSETTTSAPHVSMDMHEVVFGNCADSSMGQQKTVNVTNHTKGRIRVAWMGGVNKVYSVSPAELDIPPQSSAVFQVAFRPTAANQFYGAELECYAYYKSLRDYRLVEDTTHFPPWCLSLVATGNTFMANNETFLPRFKLDSHKLVFPAVNANEATYRTVLLSNGGTTPIDYDFEKDPENVYTMKPTKGLLAPGQNQVFVVKAMPPEVKTYRQSLRLKLNDSEKHAQEIQVIGSAESAEVLLENEGVLYFKTTCVGTGSQRQYAVKNTSRIPLRFEWKMKHADGKVIKVEPSSGLIQPNENQFHTWTFSPEEREKYVLKPALIVWGQGQSSSSSGGKKRQFTVRVIGEGSLGEIKTDQTYIDFGTVVMGSTQSKTITLVNDGDCSLYYELDIDQKIEGPYSEDMVRNDPCSLTLDCTSGLLPARSRYTITATVRPKRRVYYQWAISYRLQTPNGEPSEEEILEPQHLCHVLSTGVYPCMAVTDARCYGSAIGIGKKQLWNLFSLDNLNMIMDADPAPSEVVYNIGDKRGHQRLPEISTRAVLDFNFSAAPIGSEPCVIQIMFENTGSVTSEWAFLLPTDLQLELEYWAETGEFDDEELHEMKVMDNKLFTIEPKRGKLEPGECRSVSFSYQHMMAGTDRLPVLFKFNKGREILVNFVGVTVPLEKPYIHFSSSKHMFAPVPIGEKNSPKQIYELYNGGALPVKYEFDCQPLQYIRDENFDHPIFECLNPKGKIAPGHSANVEFRFSPLEARTYMVDLPVMIHNGDTALVTFTGVGYDKRALGDTMPVTDQPESSGVPGVQSVAVPGQLCCLSQERISFGNMVLFSKGRRLVSLINKSMEHTVSYVWHVTKKKDAKNVSISPSQGTLEPGQAAICRVSFTAKGFPSFFDIDLICEVTNMTEYNAYQNELMEWEDEKARQRVEFTITETDIDADEHLLPGSRVQSGTGSRVQSSVSCKSSKSSISSSSSSSSESSVSKSSKTTERVQSGKSLQEDRPPSRLQALAIRSPSPDMEFAKYKTLPPIRQCTIDSERRREREKRRFKDHFWARPTAPKPFLLHLGVTARTHDAANFQQNFADDYKNFYVDRLLSEGEDRKPAPVIPEDTKVTCVEAEADIVAGALADIFRGLLDDTTFHESCQKVMEAETPYYQQITDKKLPHPLTPPPTLDAPGIFVGDDTVTMTTRSEVQSTAKTYTSEVDEEAPRDFRPAPPSPDSLSSCYTRNTSAKTGVSKNTVERSKEASIIHSQKQQLKKFPEFGNATETIIENTLMNIIQEAFAEEFNITARPRMVALPPKPSTPQGRRSSKQ